LDAIARFKLDLWPDGTLAEHRAESEATIAGRPPSTLPLEILVAQAGGEVIGFVEVGLRSHADGCDGQRPVGFVEGLYVAPEHRRRAAARELISAAERWSRAQGCGELASDALIDNAVSQATHEALGFEVVDRCVHYRKPI